MARDPPPKRLDQCANCCVPVGVRITDDQGQVDMSKTSVNCQAKVSAFIINADGHQSKIRVTDALKEVYKLNLLQQNPRGNNGELYLCYKCSLIFPKLYKLFLDFYSLRKADSILAQNLIHLENLIAELRSAASSCKERDLASVTEEHHGNISVRRDIFEPEESLKEPNYLRRSFDGASGDSLPTFYLEENASQRKGRPLSSLYLTPEMTEITAVTNSETDWDDLDDSDVGFKFAGKVQRQYSKGIQVMKAMGEVKNQKVKVSRIPQEGLVTSSTKNDPRLSLSRAILVKKSAATGMLEAVNAKRIPQLVKIQSKLVKVAEDKNPTMPVIDRPRNETEDGVVKEEPLEEIPLQHFLAPPKSKKPRMAPESHDCPNCFRPFTSEFLLKCHREYCRSQEEIRDLVPKKKPKCPICNRIFEEGKAVLEHVRLKHRAVRRFSCDNCKLNFKSEKGLSAHKAKCHKKTDPVSSPVKCDDCDLTFPSKVLMGEHYEKEHDGPPKLTPIVGSRRSERKNKGQHRFKSRLDL